MSAFGGCEGPRRDEKLLFGHCLSDPVEVSTYESQFSSLCRRSLHHGSLVNGRFYLNLFLLCLLSPRVLALSAPLKRVSSKSGVAPDFPCRFHDEAQFRGLALAGDVVAVHRAGKAALRRQAKLLDRDMTRRFFDAALEQILRFQLPDLGAHQSEHDGLALRYEAQRRKTPRAHIVVFQEITVDGQFIEQHFGHRFVATFCGPCATEIAPAQ